jgi:hypothetical protein
MIACSIDAVGALLRIFEFCWVMARFKLPLIQVSATEVPAVKIRIAPDLQNLIRCYQEKEVPKLNKARNSRVS